MAKLEITLHEKDGDVTYKQNHVSGQKYLDFWNLQEKIEKGQLSAVQSIEQKIEYVSGLFTDDKLTAKQILAGLDPWEISKTIERITNIVLGLDGKENEKKEQ